MSEERWIHVPPPLNRLINLDKVREVKLAITYGEPVLQIFWGKADYLKLDGPIAIDTWNELREVLKPRAIVQKTTKAQIKDMFGDYEYIEEEDDDANDDD